MKFQIQSCEFKCFISEIDLEYQCIFHLSISESESIIDLENKKISSLHLRNEKYYQTMKN